MNPNINSLDSISECEVILDIATEIKNDFERKLLTASQRQALLANSAVGLDQKIAWATEDLEKINAEIALMPAGRDKEAAITQRMRIELNLRILNGGSDKNGIIALLETDLNVGMYTVTLEKIDAFIAEVEAKMSQLPAAA